MSHFDYAVTNRLSGDGAKLKTLGVQGINNTFTGKWHVTGASVVDLSDSEFGPDHSYGQVRFVKSSAQPFITLGFDALILKPDDDDEFIELSFYAKMPGGGQIQVSMYDTTSIFIGEIISEFEVEQTTPSEGSLGLADSSWKAYRTSPLRVFKGNLQSPRIDIEITFNPYTSNTEVWFANPVVSGLMDHMYYSEAMKSIVPNIPDVMFEETMQSTPPAALSRFADVMYSGFDIAAKALRDYRFFTIEDGRDESNPATLSNLVWPSETNFVEARWLTQFAGTHPISKLSSSLDPSDPFILNSSQLNGADTLRFSSTAVLEPPEATIDVVTDFLRWQAQYGYFGINAGSMQAIKEATKRVMIGAKQVTVTVQHDGPFTILVETPWDQTYGGAQELIGESSVVVEEAISYAKPIGVKVTHVLT